MYFEYGQKEIEYLKSRDKKLGEAIDRIGHIYRECDSDLFTSIVKQIVGQQISAPAFKTVWRRVEDKLGDVNAENICSISDDELQSCGLSYRKVSYIKDFAQKVSNGEFDVEKLCSLNDEDVIKSLTSLNGIGVWTAEMLMLFCMQRPDIVSFGDLAIIRGMRMLYRHRKIDKEMFRRYRRRYSPYGSVASLYLWAISAGAIPQLTDPAPKKKKEK
ncbi:MAG: DNA-3-methyladenine glycosylase 2 family protein [Oscillospiraceae bacterium]|nr:DNA-3-methyladenine glycosylase 2 family protein [Oscillospiraceae bacterium]